MSYFKVNITLVNYPGLITVLIDIKKGADLKIIS
jgi:hypothetical protein